MTDKYRSRPSQDFKIPHVNVGYDHGTEVSNGKSQYALSPTSIALSSAASIQPVTYSWENIEIYANITQGNCFKRAPTIEKRILSQVTGAVRPGEFLAIMGASGAGKTTLLNCLTFRNTGKLKIKGERLLNGEKIDTDSLARISGYVQQDDLFIGTLKVGEVLRFQALLRMDKHFTYEERMNRVEEVILEFGLSKCRDTLIGNPAKNIKGISGGERKRLAFACEVLTNPSLMFCDEPTSGLDSFMAQNIVQSLQTLARAGKTVICTIHQPSSEVFAMFDRILLMAEGRTAFLGPIDEALTFFASQGMPCPANFNPADFYIFTLAVVPGQESETRQRIAAICDTYDNSDARQRVEQIVRSNRVPAANSGTLFGSDKKSRSPYKTNWFNQFGAVLWRSWISIIRDPQILLVKASSSVFIALLIALIYQGQSLDAESVQNIQGVLFLFLTNSTFENVFAVINTFSFELPIFIREHFNGMYRTDVYFLSKTMAELIIYIFFPFVLFAIPYYAIGLNPQVERFFIGAGIVILVANVATSYGYFISCLATSPQMAVALSAPLIIPMMLFGGFFLKSGTTPNYLDWIRYLSWFNYGNEALSYNQWHDVEFTSNNTNCQYLNYTIPPEVIGNLPDDVGSILLQLVEDFQKAIVCNGEDILRAFNFTTENIIFIRDILCLMALILGFRILAFLALLNKSYKKQ